MGLKRDRMQLQPDWTSILSWRHGRSIEFASFFGPTISWISHLTLRCRVVVKAPVCLKGTVDSIAVFGLLTDCAVLLKTLQYSKDGNGSRRWPRWHLMVSPEGLNSAHLPDSLFSKDLTSCFVILAFISHPGSAMTWSFCAFRGVKTLVFLCTVCCFSTLPLLFIWGTNSYP